VIALVSGVTPALPLHTAGKYVAAAFIVLFALVLVYVAIMAIRLSRLERELGDLLELAERQDEPARPGESPAETRESTLA
jgi:CcmD family protein